MIEHFLIFVVKKIYYYKYIIINIYYLFEKSFTKFEEFGYTIACANTYLKYSLWEACNSFMLE